MLYKDEAIVLRTMRLGESDRIVTMLGQAQGKIRAVAKGVRKTKSRFGGRLEPFSHVRLQLWRSRHSLDIVNQAEVIQPFREIREDLHKFALGEVILEGADRVVQEAESSSRLFRLVVEALGSLTVSSSPLILARFLMTLTEQAGFGASLDRCAECGAGPGWFSPAQGGAVCRDCRSPDSDEVSKGVLLLLGDLRSEGDWLTSDKQTAREALRLSRKYTEYHLERRLRSADSADLLGATR